MSGYSSTGGNVKSQGDTSYGQTLSGSYADDNINGNDVYMDSLQQQQIQYQQLFQKHAISRNNTSPIAEVDDLTAFYKGERPREKVELGADSPVEEYHRYVNKKELDDSGSSKFELIP